MKAAPSAARVGNADGTECEQPALAGARWDVPFYRDQPRILRNARDLAYSY